MSLTIKSLEHPDQFVRRHIGPDAAETSGMLALLGHKNLDELIDAAVPKKIRLGKKLNLPAARSEHDALAELRRIASENKVFRSFIGQGYYDCITPPVIQRNVLENPGSDTGSGNRANRIRTSNRRPPLPPPRPAAAVPCCWKRVRLRSASPAARLPPGRRGGGSPCGGSPELRRDPRRCRRVRRRNLGVPRACAVRGRRPEAGGAPPSAGWQCAPPCGRRRGRVRRFRPCGGRWCARQDRRRRSAPRHGSRRPAAARSAKPATSTTPRPRPGSANSRAHNARTRAADPPGRRKSNARRWCEPHPRCGPGTVAESPRD